MRFVVALSLCLTFGHPLFAESHDFGGAVTDPGFGRPIDTNFKVGCRDLKRRQTAIEIGDALREDLLRLPGVKEVSYASCDPYAVPFFLGKPTPIFVRAPDPICGVQLTFESTAAGLETLRDLWDGRLGNGPGKDILEANGKRAKICPAFDEPGRIVAQ